MDAAMNKSEAQPREQGDAAEILLDLSRQQRNLLLLRPLFQLELSKNKFGDASSEDVGLFEGVDTHYLVLATLDYMLEATTVALGFTQSEVLDHLAKVAGAMKPSLSRDQCMRVAEVVLDTLDNKTRGYQEFAFDYYDGCLF